MKKQISLMMACLILAGCGTEETVTQNNSDNLPSPENLVASNIFQIVRPNTEQIVDIKNILSDSNANFSLELLNTAQNENCKNYDIKNEEISFSLKAGDYCAYQYQVQNEQKTATASLEIYSTESLEPSLPPLAGEILLTEENQTLTFDIAALMPIEGYRLDRESLQIFSSNDNIGSVETSTKEIIYTAPELKQTGWNRIHYNLVGVNPEQALSPKMGVIYISLLDSANPAPSINEPNYQHQTSFILHQDPMQLDLNDLDGLEILDDDGWKIVHVSSYDDNATVTTDENTSLTFSATELGKYKITYIVADPLGAASIGHITVNVSIEDKEVTWFDVHLTLTDKADEKYEVAFSAAPRYLSLNDAYNITPIPDPTVDNTIAGFTLEQALHYCEGRGGIPTVELFTSLVNSSEVSEAVAAWPKGQPYLAKNADDTYMAFDFVSKTDRAISAEDKLYASCINDGKVIIEQKVESIAAGETPIHVFSIEHEVDANISVTVTHDNDEELKTKIEKNDTFTQTNVYVSSTKVGIISFTVSSSSPSKTLYPELTLSRTISVTPDVASAKLESIKYEDSVTSTEVDEVIADGRDSVLMKITVTDQYQNLVLNEDVEVNVEYKTESSPTQEALVKSHEDIFSLCGSEEGNNSACISIDKTDTYSFTIKAARGFTPLPRDVIFKLSLNGNESDIGDSYPLRFIDAVCKDGYNSEATGKCLKVLEEVPGFLFTAPPSIDFYNYARSFHQGEQNLLPNPGIYGQNVEVSTINNGVRLGQFALELNAAQYFGIEGMEPIFTNEDNFAVFRTKPAYNNGQRYLPSQAWCQALNEITFMGISTWQMLSLNGPGTTQFLNYIKIPSPVTNDHDPNHHILFSKHGWYLRAHDQITWYKGTAADNNTGINGQFSVGVVELGTGIARDNALTGGNSSTDFGFGHTVCQAAL